MTLYNIMDNGEDFPRFMNLCPILKINMFHSTRKCFIFFKAKVVNHSYLNRNTSES